MANWHGAARSNYVRIKNMEGLRKALDPFPIRIEKKWKDDSDNDVYVCFLSEELDSGGWPGWAYDSSDDDGQIEFDPAVLICPYMADDQILVMMEVGHEKLRVLTAYATAYNAKGAATSLRLDDIYSQAGKFFGVDRSSISTAEY